VANLIDISFFFGELNIAQKTESAGSLGIFIDEMEPRLLTDLLGYELYKAYTTGIAAGSPEAKWLALRDGKEFTNRAGHLTYWPGLRFTKSGSSITPITEIVKFLDPIQFKIGDGGTLTPVAGTIRYTNTLLDNVPKDRIEIFRNEYGVLFPDLHYTKVTTDDFFELIAPDQFGPEEEFTVKITVEENAATTISAGVKKSLIANYVYWHWMADQSTVTTGTGEKASAAANAVDVSPARKMVRAWNQMVKWNCELVEFLLSNPTDYPEFQNYYGRIPADLLKYQNTFGI